MSKAPTSKRPAVDEVTGSWPFFSPFSAFGTGNGQGLDAWVEIGNTVMSACSQMQQEGMRFMSHRIEADLDHQRSLTGCRSPEEAINLVSSFAKTLVGDYADETRRMVDAASEIQSACARVNVGTASAAMAVIRPDPAGHPSE